MSWSRSFIRASFVILWLLAGLGLLLALAAGAMRAHAVYGDLDHMGKALRTICTALVAIVVIGGGAALVMLAAMAGHITLSVAQAIIDMHDRMVVGDAIPSMNVGIKAAAVASPTADDIEREQVRRFNSRPVD